MRAPYNAARPGHGPAEERLGHRVLYDRAVEARHVTLEFHDILEKALELFDCAFETPGTA